MSAAPKFVIEEEEEEPSDKPESDLLVSDRAVGTLGFCSAFLACWACCCSREIRESYMRGRVSREELVE